MLLRNALGTIGTMLIVKKSSGHASNYYRLLKLLVDQHAIRAYRFEVA